MNPRHKLAAILCCFALCGSAVIINRLLEAKRAAVRPAELYDVVWSQINAFREADYSGAYRQVSTSFQERFNIEAFADLVRTEYPAVARAERVEFGAVRRVGRHAIVQVFFFLPDGETVPCFYSLVNEDGVWKIDGTRLHRRWPSSHRIGGFRT